MPKRWERELQRLGDVQAPLDEIRSRSARPSMQPLPTDGLPSTRQRIVAGIVAFGVFIAAGTFLVRAIDLPIEAVSDPPRDVTSVPATESGVTVALVDDSSIVLTVDGRGFEPLATDVIDYRVIVDIPADLEVRVEPGDATEWTDEVMRTRGKQLGSGVPRLPAFRGTALWFWRFELPDGKVVAGHFAVELAPTEGAPSDVLRIRCDRDGSTTVLTPFVAAQADGVQVVVHPVGPSRQVGFLESGSDSSFGGKIAADGESHPWPIAPGSAEVACGSGASDLAGAQLFEVVDPAGNWAAPELSCADTGRAEVVGYDGGAVEWVSVEEAIRGILIGVLPDDRVMQPLYGRDRLLRWVIVRHGRVVGVVGYTSVTDVSDPRGGGLGRVTGEVCASSGIAGTVPPRDPDQDGVVLDCMAASQVAFGEPTGVVRVSEGETFIRARVSGIRSTDRVVSPVGVDGDDGWDGVWTVEREGKTVASINYPALDGITCRFNAIGTA
jgi:hypothetical protein